MATVEELENQILHTIIDLENKKSNPVNSQFITIYYIPVSKVTQKIIHDIPTLISNAYFRLT